MRREMLLHTHNNSILFTIVVNNQIYLLLVTIDTFGI